MKKHVFLDQTVVSNVTFFINKLKEHPIASLVVEVVSNVTFFINKRKEHPIGCGINLPDFIVNNTGLNALQKNKKTGKLYSDNLCLFRCLAPHTDCTLQNLESKTKELFLCYYKFAIVDPSTFQGITLHDLVQIEKCFSLNVNVYALEWNKRWPEFFGGVDIFFPAQQTSIFMKTILAI